MSFEIRHNPGVANRIYWAELYDGSKNVWDNSTNTFRDESLATAAHRAITLSDNALVGKYWGDIPEVPAGLGYQWFVRRVGGSGFPTLADAIELVGDVFNWDGSRVYDRTDTILVNGAALGVGGTVPADVRAVFGTALTAAYVPADLLKINGSDFTLTSIRNVNVNQRDINIEDRT